MAGDAHAKDEKGRSRSGWRERGEGVTWICSSFSRSTKVKRSTIDTPATPLPRVSRRDAGRHNVDIARCDTLRACPCTP
eukprot:2162740-Rhodomonas_salina.1